jgi:hypothetical protein
MGLAECALLGAQPAKNGHAVSVISFIGKHDSAGTEVVERRVGDLPVVRLSRRQAIGSPCASTTARILGVSPPRERRRR